MIEMRKSKTNILLNNIKTSQDIAAWVKSNINGISRICKWGEVKSIYKHDLNVKAHGGAIVCVLVVHEDDTETHLLCESCSFEDENMPFAAVLYAFTAIEAIETLNRRNARVVVVSQSISERMIKEVHARIVPVAFLSMGDGGFWYRSLKY